MRGRGTPLIQVVSLMPNFRRLPFDRLGPLHRHVRITGGVQCDGMSAVGGILGALQPIAKFLAVFDDAASIFAHEQIVSLAAAARDSGPM